jgi:hypothetical protein
MTENEPQEESSLSAFTRPFSELTDAEKRVVEDFFAQIRQPGIAVEMEHSEIASAEHQFNILRPELTEEEIRERSEFFKRLYDQNSPKAKELSRDVAAMRAGDITIDELVDRWSKRTWPHVPDKYRTVEYVLNLGPGDALIPGGWFEVIAMSLTGLLSSEEYSEISSKMDAVMSQPDEKSKGD